MMSTLSTSRNVKTDNPDDVGGTKTVYGDQILLNMRRVVSGTAVHGFVPANFRTVTKGDGVVEVSDGLIHAQCPGVGLARVHSFRSLKSNTGEGAMIRVSGYFNNPHPSYGMCMGGSSVSDAVGFGYRGTTFGFWHRHDAVSEVWKLDIDVAKSKKKTATITLQFNSELTYVIDVDRKKVPEDVAAYINERTNQDGWSAEQIDETVVLHQARGFTLNGVLVASATNSVTVTPTQITASRPSIDAFVPIDKWNGTRLGAWFDPQKAP